MELKRLLERFAESPDDPKMQNAIGRTLARLVAQGRHKDIRTFLVELSGVNERGGEFSEGFCKALMVVGECVNLHMMEIEGRESTFKLIQEEPEWARIVTILGETPCKLLELLPTVGLELPELEQELARMVALDLLDVTPTGHAKDPRLGLSLCGMWFARRLSEEGSEGTQRRL